MSSREVVSVQHPYLVGESTEGWEEEIHSFEDMDRMILSECGYSEDSPRYNRILESAVADSDDEKIFTIDKFRSYGLDDAADEILKDEVFDRYWRESIYDRLDPESDAELVEQWDDAFIGEEVRKHLAGLKKIEKFYYIDFFRKILSKSSNDEAVNLIDFDDKAFDEMPDVMRLY